MCLPWPALKGVPTNLPARHSIEIGFGILTLHIKYEWPPHLMAFKLAIAYFQHHSHFTSYCRQKLLLTATMTFSRMSVRLGCSLFILCWTASWICGYGIQSWVHTFSFYTQVFAAIPTDTQEICVLWSFLDTDCQLCFSGQEGRHSTAQEFLNLTHMSEDVIP